VRVNNDRLWCRCAAGVMRDGICGECDVFEVGVLVDMRLSLSVLVL
jgi:hypothetical protein